MSRAFTTGLPAGSDCDVMAGGLKNGGCQGAAVVVAKDGMAKIDVPAMTALVIHVGQKQ